MTLGDLAAIGGVISAQVTVGGLTFFMGRLSNRVEALETWRASIRTDFHEVDDKLEALTNQVGQLQVVIQERTERREHPRPIRT